MADIGWYYMNSSGQMTTGWQQIGGSWYFLRQSANQYGTGPAGSMLANTSAYINGKTYYFNANSDTERFRQTGRKEGYEYSPRERLKDA